MHINYLILAHKNLSQLKRLVHRLSENNPADLSIYIHLDRKWELTDEEILSIENLNNHTAVIPERVSCRLDDWSLIEAEMSLVTYALSHSKEDAYFVMMSGQDYPIQPNEAFHDFCKKRYPTPLIDVTPWARDNWVHLKFMNSPLYKSLTAVNPKNRMLNFVFRAFRRGLDTLIPSNFKMKHKFDKSGVSLYGGSQWWVLPGQALKEIKEEFDSNKALINEYKKTLTPEETFFQTMVMRTSHASMVTVNLPEQVWQDCPTFAYFNPGEGKKFTGHPYIIGEAAWREICEKKDYFFARKFDERVDSDILDIVDSEIHGK